MRRPTAVPWLPGDRLWGCPSHTHHDTHAPTLSTASTAPPAAASARPPRAPTLQRPGPLRGRPARGPRGLPTAPERWRRLGPAQLQGSKSTGAPPGLPGPRPHAGRSSYLGLPPREPAVPPACTLSRVRSLPPRAGPPRVVAGARSPPGVTAWADDSSPARGPRGRARRSRAQAPGTRARPSPRARLASWFLPARAPQPRGPFAPPCAAALRGPGTLCAQRGAGARSAGPAPRAPAARRVCAQAPRTCCFVWVGAITAQGRGRLWWWRLDPPLWPAHLPPARNQARVPGPLALRPRAEVHSNPDQ